MKGWLCGKGKPPYGDKYTLAPEGTWFFRDDGGEITGGFMHTLVMWNTELSEGEVGRRQEGTRARSGAAQLAAGLVRQIPRQGSVFIMAQARCRVLRVFLVAQSACYLLQGAGLG